MQPCYLTQMTCGGIDHYLFWIDGGNSPDFFLATELREVYVSSSKVLANELVGNLGLLVLGEASFNIDKVLFALTRTKKMRILSSSECKSVLDGWNMIEDLAKTMSFKIPPYSEAKKRSILKCYEKFFDRADILEIFAESGAQLPYMSRRERIIAKTYLLNAWRHVCKKGKWHRL